MTHPPKLKLLERRPGTPFQTARSFVSGQSLLTQDELKLGLQVGLRDEKNVEILATVMAIEGDAVTGKIEDFPGHGPTYLGMNLGDPITFREVNVFIAT